MFILNLYCYHTALSIKITAAQNEGALSLHKVRGL